LNTLFPLGQIIPFFFGRGKKISPANQPAKMQLQCPNCGSTGDAPLVRCKYEHIYCDTCACVQIIGADNAAEDTVCAFCPLCVAPPDEYVCPITHALMEDPVVAQDGFSYERDAIADWFSKKASSPKTGIHISTMLYANQNLKSLISNWKQLHRYNAQIL
jgi:hypothetical protein